MFQACLSVEFLAMVVVCVLLMPFHNPCEASVSCVLICYFLCVYASLIYGKFQCCVLQSVTITFVLVEPHVSELVIPDR